MNMKMMSAVFVSSLLVFSVPVFADDSSPQGVGVKPVKAEKKAGRKKRVLMCKDCGKAEKNCECKGEEHRKDDAHENDSKKEEKK